MHMIGLSSAEPVRAAASDLPVSIKLFMMEITL
jgi:hypothetical protein